MQENAPIVCGSFELLEPIAEGGVATIWRGRHVDLDIPMAIKVITGPIAGDRQKREAFRREVQAQASLDHPGVATVFEHGTISPVAESASNRSLVAGSPYCAIEYTAAGSLRDQEDVDNWPLLRSLLLEILDALAHAHARGVIHRDLKPQNILYFPGEERGRFKLSDFGIAHALDSEIGIDTDQIDDATAGTPHYMPPEQLQGEWRVFGPWTDLYALGCLTYEIVHGSLPFDGESLAQVAVQQLTEEPKPLEPEFPIPRGFRAWIRCLMAKDLRDRFRRAADAAWLLSQMPKRVESSGHGDDTNQTSDENDAAEEDAKAAFTGARPETRRLWSVGADEGRQERSGDEELPTTTLLFEKAEPELTTLEAQTTREMYGSGGHEYDTEGEERDPLEIAFQEGPPPPLPEDWRYRLPDRLPASFVGAGLDLFGLRNVPFVGREEQRDRIWKQLRSVSRERSVRAVEISGSSGAGKTRLAEWMARRAHELGGVEFLRAGHSRQGGPTEGLPGMLESALNAWELDRKRTYKRVLMEIKARYGPLDDSVRRIEDEARALTEIIYPTPGGIADVDGPRYRFSSAEERYGAIVRLVEELSRERPVVLLFDDVQWGVDSVRFVESLMRGERELPVLVLMTVQRDVLEEGSVVASALESLARLDSYEGIELGPLDESEQAEMINRMLPLEPRLAQTVFQQASGLPLFTVQLLGDWIERGVLEVGSRGFTVRSSEDSPPATIDDLWEDRVDWLVERLGEEGGEEKRRALEIAAALGPHVDLEEWRAVCERSGAEADDALYRRLTREGLAWPMAQGWSFVHKQLVDELERQARAAGRWGDHNLKCAATLRELYPETDARRRRRVVEHFLEAGESERALEPMLAVGRYLYEIGEYERLDDLLDERLRILDELRAPEPDPRRIQNCRLRARVALRVGNLERASELAETVRDRAETFGVEVELGWAGFLEGQIAHRRGLLEAALEALDGAREIFSATRNVRGMAWALKETGAVLQRRAVFDRARAAYNRAAELFDRLDEVAQRIDVRICAARTWFAEGEVERAAEHYRELLRQAREYGEDRRKGECWKYIGDVRRVRGEWEEADEAYCYALELAADRDRLRCDELRLSAVLTALGRGDFDGARSRLTEVRRRPVGAFGRIHALAEASVAGSHGEWDRWEEALDRAEAGLANSEGVEVDEGWVAELGSQIADDAGAPERARRMLEFAARRWERLGRSSRSEACRTRLEALEAQ